jgi:hypothetical protein
VVENKASQTRWYAVQTHPNREFMAEGALAAIEGIETFLPTLHVKPVNPRSRTERPFFPGYLFVCADLSALGSWSTLWAASSRPTWTCARSKNWTVPRTSGQSPVRDRIHAAFTPQPGSSLVEVTVWL